MTERKLEGDFVLANDRTIEDLHDLVDLGVNYWSCNTGKEAHADA